MIRLSKILVKILNFLKKSIKKVDTIERKILNSFEVWITLMIFSVLIFMGGFHNFDWSQNMDKLNAIIECRTNQTDFFQDQSISGKVFTYVEGYRIGLMMVFSSFFVFGFSSYRLGKILGRWKK